MPAPTDHELRRRSRTLRSAMTDEERRLWFDFLRERPEHFRRQYIIGCYVVDFYCRTHKIIIELDGSQHYEERGAEYDRARDEFLRSSGNIVLRYSNKDINKRFSGVCEDILKYLQP